MRLALAAPLVPVLLLLAVSPAVAEKDQETLRAAADDARGPTGGDDDRPGPGRHARPLRLPPRPAGPDRDPGIRRRAAEPDRAGGGRRLDHDAAARPARSRGAHQVRAGEPDLRAARGRLRAEPAGHRLHQGVRLQAGRGHGRRQVSGLVRDAGPQDAARDALARRRPRPGPRQGDRHLPPGPRGRHETDRRRPGAARLSGRSRAEHGDRAGGHRVRPQRRAGADLRQRRGSQPRTSTRSPAKSR